MTCIADTTLAELNSSLVREEEGLVACRGLVATYTGAVSAAGGGLLASGPTAAALNDNQVGGGSWGCWGGALIACRMGITMASGWCQGLQQHKHHLCRTVYAWVAEEVGGWVGVGGGIMHGPGGRQWGCDVSGSRVSAASMEVHSSPSAQPRGAGESGGGGEEGRATYLQLCCICGQLWCQEMGSPAWAACMLFSSCTACYSTCGIALHSRCFCFMYLLSCGAPTSP